MIKRSAFVLISFVFLGLSSFAREVNSREDELRLSGYKEHIKELQLAEKKRVSDVDEIAKEKIRNWDAREKALREYKKEKAKRPPVMDESGPEWRDYVKEKMSEYNSHEKARNEFIRERKEKRAREHKVIDLSEEQELEIAEKTDRVDWRKRKFAEGGSTGGRSSFDYSPTFTPPPAYSGGTPGYFDAPPPPPPVYEPFDEGMYPPPPPPPPPMFEEEAPF